MQNYKDLLVWKKTHDLVLFVYKLTVAYPKIEQFSLTNQLRRAAVSIPTNIAEGCGKYSQADLSNFLQTALGLSNEVDYLLFLSRELSYLDDETFKESESQVNEVKAMLISLISKVRNKH